MSEQEKLERVSREKNYIRHRISIPASFALIVGDVEQLLKNRKTDHTKLFSDRKTEYHNVIGRSEVLQYL